MKRAFVLLLLVFAPTSALAHGRSKSFAEWIFRARTAELRISFAGHDVLAAVPGIDANKDKLLSPAELEAMRDLVGRRTIEQTIFATSEEGAPVACRPGEAAVRSLGDPVVAEVEVRAAWRCEAGLRKVHVELRQLPELEPPHITVATFLAGKTTAQHVFSPVAPAFDLEAELPSLAEELGATALAGVRSLVTPAALLFLLGVLLFERPKRTLLLFAIFLGALHGAGLTTPLSPPPSWYGFVLAFAVAWAGLELIARRQEAMPTRKPIVAALFSLWFGAVLAPAVDLPHRLAFAVGETAVGLVIFALCTVLAVLLREAVGRYRRPVGIAWLCGAGALTVLSLI